MMKILFSVRKVAAISLLLLAAIATPARAQLNATATYVLGTGTNAITATIPGVVSTNDLFGVPIRVILVSNNTGAVTFNPNGLGATAVQKWSRNGLTALTGGELLSANYVMELVWNGTVYICFSCTAPTYKLPTYQYLTSGSAATYTTPVGVTRLEIAQIGGGGGGAASGVGSGGTGGTTTFGSTTTIGGGGSVNASPSTPGAGGSGGTTGTGTVIRRLSGGTGNAGINATQASGSTLTLSVPGGGGCVSQFAGASPNDISGTAINAIANSGSGGAGSRVQIASGAGTYNSMAGGGCGEYVEYYVNAPSATYTYTIGAGGTAANSSAGVGGGGGVVVKEFYN
jgi:hypothetical protein